VAGGGVVEADLAQVGELLRVGVADERVGPVGRF